MSGASHNHHHGDHDHHHDNHGHGHHHHSLPGNFDKAFVTALVLNSLFVVIEFGYGLLINSTALMADAGHNLSDVLGLVLAWSATLLARKPPSERYTYGLRSSSILAALANAMFLLLACGAIAWEAVMRFSQPPPVAGFTVSVIAIIGIFVNGISAWLFAKGSKGDLNIRGAYLHMLGDAAISVGVALTGVAMAFSHWYWLDPAISLVIVIVVVMGTWGLLRESLQLALHAVPPHIHIEKIDQFLRSCDGVADVQDLHIWGMSTTETALTAHLIMPNGCTDDAMLDEIAKSLEHEFQIHHCTLQIERSSADHACALIRAVDQAAHSSQ